MLGISLTGVTREQVFIVLYGPGGTGKSTLLESIQSILGDYAIAVPSDTLLIRKHGISEERKLAPFAGGARFVATNETEQGGMLDENLIKQITGEDSVAARQLYEEQFNFLPQAKIWLRTNNKPELRSGMSAAIERRIILLPFGKIIPPEQKDTMLKEKLRAEAEGIFRWMVDGYLDYAQTGELYRAPIVQAEVEKYRTEQDVIGRFLETTCEFGKEFYENREELYRYYKTFCENQNERVVLDSKQFKTQITPRFEDLRVIEQQKFIEEKQLWVWVGVRLKHNLHKFLKKRHAST